MRALPTTAAMSRIARKIVWFEEPERALSDPIRFLAYAMARASAEDMAEIRRHLTDDDFLEAIDHAPSGIIDARSWAYWNLVIGGRSPPPPLPTRTLG
jgi:hypothetical protein